MIITINKEGFNPFIVEIESSVEFSEFEEKQIEELLSETMQDKAEEFFHSQLLEQEVERLERNPAARIEAKLLRNPNHY